MQTETLHLPVVLSQSELLAFGKEAGELDLAMRLAREDLDAVKKAAAETAKTNEARRREIARMQRDGVEMRSVECEIRFDFDAGVARTVRLDTDEVVSERAVTDEERQTSFGEAPRRVVAKKASKKDDEKTHTGRPSKKKARIVRGAA